MNTQTGEILTPEQMRLRILLDEKLAPYLKPMNRGPTPVQLARRPPRVGRNEPCPCGSGRKFKNCCLTD